MKTFNIKEQLQNCETFLKYWETIPEKNVYPGLEKWVEYSTLGIDNKHTCNTIACAGGWLPAMPEFAAMGITLDEDGRPSLPIPYHNTPIAHHLFGENTLVIPVTLEETTRLKGKVFSEKIIVTNRFKKQIKSLIYLLRSCP